MQTVWTIALLLCLTTPAYANMYEQYLSRIIKTLEKIEENTRGVPCQPHTIAREDADGRLQIIQEYVCNGGSSE